MDRMTRSFTPVRNTSFATTHPSSTSFNNNNNVKDTEDDKTKTIAHCKSLESKHDIHSHPDHHELLAKESLEYKHKEDNPLLVPLEIQHSVEAHINPSFNEHNKINVHNVSVSGSFTSSNNNNNNNKCMCTDVEAFWWDCGPQEVHKLLVNAMVLECRARSIEPVGPTHLHRFGRLLHDVHRLLTIHIKLMSLIVTEHFTEKAQNNNHHINHDDDNNHVYQKNKADNTPHLTSTHQEQHHFLSSLQHTKDEIIPHNTIWSTHLLLLSLWLSKECTVEKMVDLIGDENVSLVMNYPGNVPAAFTLLLALGEYVTSFITNLSSLPENSLMNEHCVINHKKINFAEELHHIRCKINVLLSEGHQRGPSLRQFITTGLLNQSDRFRELWLEEFVNNNNDDDDHVNNNNYDKCVKKFKTRVEMLHYAVVERLLKSLEKMPCTRHDHSSTLQNNDHENSETNNECQVHKTNNAEHEMYTHEGQTAIFDYLKMWHKYFVSLEEYASKHSVYNNDSNKYAKGNEEQNEKKLLQEMKDHKHHNSEEQLHSHFVEQNAKVSTNSNTIESIPVNEKSCHENTSTNQLAHSNDNTVCTKQEMDANDADNNDLDDLLDESEEQVAHCEVCESLHIINSRFLPRLKYGKSILPTLAVCFETHHAKHDHVLSNVSFRATNTNTNTSKEEDAKVCTKENEQEEQHINNKDDDVHNSSNNLTNKSEKELDDRFVYAQTEFAQVASHCSNEVKLKFYGLYKQAIDGDVNKSAP